MGRPRWPPRGRRGRDLGAHRGAPRRPGIGADRNHAQRGRPAPPGARIAAFRPGGADHLCDRRLGGPPGLQPAAAPRGRSRCRGAASAPGFRGWRIAIYQPRGTSPVASVRRQVSIGMGALAVLIVVIAAGVVAVGRLVRRETEMARLKADFVANVSHDLKTPLSVIRMYGETLEMGRVPDDASRQEDYRVIPRGSERRPRLIDNVLDFSRIEGGRRRYDMAPTAVEPLIRETLDAFP